jgi:hypothetical protein
MGKLSDLALLRAVASQDACQVGLIVDHVSKRFGFVISSTVTFRALFEGVFDLYRDGVRIAGYCFDKGIDDTSELSAIAWSGHVASRRNCGCNAVSPGVVSP